MKLFPACFPDNFSSDILPKEAREQEIDVYRVIKSGNINGDAFLSTYEETKRKLRPPSRKMDLKDPGSFSTSCFKCYEEVKYKLSVFMQHHPNPIIAQGTTEPSCGVAQETKERKKVQDSHVDWWIYRDSKPHLYFKEVKKDE